MFVLGRIFKKMCGNVAKFFALSPNVCRIVYLKFSRNLKEIRGYESLIEFCCKFLKIVQTSCKFRPPCSANSLEFTENFIKKFIKIQDVN